MTVEQRAAVRSGTATASYTRNSKSLSVAVVLRYWRVPSDVVMSVDEEERKARKSSGVYQSHNPKYADIRVAQCVGGFGGINSSGPSDQIKTFHEEWKRTFIIDKNGKNASCIVYTALKMA